MSASAATKAGKWVHMARSEPETVQSHVAQDVYVSDLDENGEKKHHLRCTSDKGWSIYPNGMCFSRATDAATEWVQVFADDARDCSQIRCMWEAAYELLDIDSLRLAEFSQETFEEITGKYYTDHAQVLPPMLDWYMMAQDYDGIIVLPDAVYVTDESGNRNQSGRWTAFAARYVVPTLIVWRNLRVQKIGSSAEFLVGSKCSGYCDAC